MTTPILFFLWIFSWDLGCIYRFLNCFEPSDEDRRNLGHTKFKEPIKRWHVSPSDTQSHRNSSQSQTWPARSTRQVDTQVDTMVDLGGTRSTLWSTWGDQVDTMVDPMVDLVSGREFSRPAQFEPVFRFSNIKLSCLNLNFILKLPKVITPSYGVRFAQTRTLSQAEFRDECNGVTRFP